MEIAKQLQAALPQRVNFDDLTPRVETDGPVLMVSDSHLPYVDENLFQRMCEIIQREGVKQAIFGGDTWNMQAFSKHPIGMGTESDHIHAVQKASNYFWQTLQSLVERTDVISGNHDMWFIKHNMLELGMSDMFKLMLENVEQNGNIFTFGKGKKASDLHVHDLPTIEFTVFGERWRVTHPKSYSSTPGSVARDLADKWGCHTAIAHGHLLSATRSKSGRYWACDLGGLFNNKYLNYVHESPTRHPEMCPGFIIIKEDHIELYFGKE